MILINRTETDPFFNIAAEEYVLKHLEDDVFMLWVNRPSVIIGKHQVASAEADILFTWQNNIPVIRRISGGGTVYHDEGNLNYSLVSSGEHGKLVDYQKYAGTIIRALQKLSISASLQNKSSLFTSGKKFSGNAEHVFKNRVLHHGTLLFNSDMEMLRRCIRPAHKGYSDKSIRSVDSNTTNLIEHFPPGYSIESFRALLIEQAYEDFPEIIPYTFTDADIEAIHSLVENKYAGMEWNFGYSPRYDLKGKIEHQGIAVAYEMKAIKGKIKELNFMLNGKEVLADIAATLTNTLHHPEAVAGVLNKLTFTDQILPREKLVEGIF